ncbi:uncharacterized protein EI90DRAFT_3129278 [Cantharellus anzutake]|uniref:uncharacterized protein n=1 Tax=Cantharellus anzutake TaxID=1750568 RepID=UPI0019060652|nr:uncharacterized protein EI90DRAFT_3129278 [Cantharellus anzutake]KAF8324992.1 hypothetical protein EI90DRAFT_3129278 [Cantharellus anzutake]
MKFFHNFLASLLFFLISINSTSAIITNVIIPQGVLHGHKFTLKFLTEKSIDNTVQYYVIFGLHPGTNPVVGGNIGELVLTSPHSDLVEGGHSVTGHGSFKVDVMLPSNLKIKGKKEIFGLTVTIFQTFFTLSYPCIPNPDLTPRPPSSSPPESYPTAVHSDIHLRSWHHTSSHLLSPPMPPPLLCPSPVLSPSALIPTSDQTPPLLPPSYYSSSHSSASSPQHLHPSITLLLFSRLL